MFAKITVTQPSMTQSLPPPLPPVSKLTMPAAPEVVADLAINLHAIFTLPHAGVNIETGGRGDERTTAAYV